jgi:hypothetical protein
MEPFAGYTVYIHERRRAHLNGSAGEGVGKQLGDPFSESCFTGSGACGERYADCKGGKREDRFISFFST